MSEKPTMKDEPGKGERKDPKHESREHRLKLALRENLKRRKSQARGRSETPGAVRGDDNGSEQNRKE